MPLPFGPTLRVEEWMRVQAIRLQKEFERDEKRLKTGAGVFNNDRGYIPVLPEDHPEYVALIKPDEQSPEERARRRRMARIEALDRVIDQKNAQYSLDGGPGAQGV